MSEYQGLGEIFKRHRFGETSTICWNYKIDFFPQQGEFGICDIQTCAEQNGGM